MAPASGTTGAVVQVQPGEARALVAAGPLTPILDPVSAGVITVDGIGRVTYMDAAAEALTGVRRADAIGRTIDQVIRIGPAAGVPRDEVDERVRRVIDGVSQGEATAVTLARADGAARAVYRVDPIRSADGNPVGAVITLTDVARSDRVHGRRQALLAIERADAGESVEEVAHALVGALSPALADAAVVRVLERDATVTARAHRDPEREPLLRAIEPLLPVLGLDEPAADRAVLQVSRPTVWNGLTPDAIGAAARDPRLGTLAGDLGVRSVAVVPMRLRGGVGLLALGARDDLSQDDLAVAELVAHRAATVLDRLFVQRQLRRAVHTRERMLSSIGHDLRNPAAAISMAADILISRLPPTDSGSSLKMIHRAATQINTLIQKILDESAADAADVG